MRRRGLKLHPLLGLAVTLAVIVPAQADDGKPETPEQAHGIRITCAGAAAAAVVRADSMRPGSEKERADARELLAKTRVEALHSGNLIGRSAAQVDEAIDHSRDGILQRFARVADDPAALARKTTDLARIIRPGLVSVA